MDSDNMVTHYTSAGFKIYQKIRSYFNLFIFWDNLKTYNMQWLWRGSISDPLLKVSLNIVLTDNTLTQCL